KQATREALSNATLKLAMELGWDNVRVDQIAAAVGVSSRTFNNYFASKEDALLDVPLERANRLVSTLRERPAEESVWEALRNTVFTVVPAMFDPSRQDHRRLQIVRSTPSLSAHQLSMESEIAGRIAEGVAERVGMPAADLYPQLVGRLLMASVRTSIDHWLVSDEESPLPTLDRALDLLSRGLPDPRGDTTP